MFNTNNKIQQFTKQHCKEADFAELLERYKATLQQVSETMLARVAVQKFLQNYSDLELHQPLDLTTVQQTDDLILSGPTETITPMNLIDSHPDPIQLLANLNANSHSCAALINHHFPWFIWQSLPPAIACSGANTLDITKKSLGETILMTYLPKKPSAY